MQFPTYTPKPTQDKTKSDLTRVNAIILFRQATGVDITYAKDNYDLNWRNRDSLSVFDCGNWIKAYYKAAGGK
jgi:hypothetical protein